MYIQWNIIDRIYAKVDTTAHPHIKSVTLQTIIVESSDTKVQTDYIFGFEEKL